MGADRPTLRQAIHCCRNFGTVLIVGVHGGFVDENPGEHHQSGPCISNGSDPQALSSILLQRIEKGEIDPSFVITHSASLEDGP